MKTKRLLYLILALAGIALVLAGVFLFPEEAQKKAAGICYGVGAAAFGLGAAWLISTFFPSLNNQEMKRRKVIEAADERNTMIRDKAGAMVEKWTTYALAAWILAEGLLFSDILHILPPLVLMILRFALMVFYTNRYMKTM
jgi:membrane associated rhomboid family serine protease